MPNGSEMIYLDRFESQEAFGVNARLGAIAPIWAGASGRAILMRLPDADRMARLDVDGWRALDPSVREEVLDEIAEGQRTGYCLEHTSRFFPGVGGVAVPLADVDGTPVAAISVVLPPSELAAARATEIAAALLELAHELEAQYAPAQPVES
jgi:DNA-binding IclR family transcriptional regulator